MNEFKSEGNEHFKKKEYKEATVCYSKAIKLLNQANQVRPHRAIVLHRYWRSPRTGPQADVKILSNRAAAYLMMDKFVGAAHDGQVTPRCT